MNERDQATLSRWLDREAAGELSAEQQQKLSRAVSADPGLEIERRAYLELHRWLTPDPIHVSVDFVAAVMDRLPNTEWESKSTKRGIAAWHLPIAALLSFALAASLLLSGADGAILGTGIAFADFLQTIALAGAGLLEASWRGVGLGLEELFAGSPGTIVAFAGIVLCVDILFISLLWRKKPEPVSNPVHTDDGF